MVMAVDQNTPVQFMILPSICMAIILVMLQVKNLLMKN